MVTPRLRSLAALLVVAALTSCRATTWDDWRDRRALFGRVPVERVAAADATPLTPLPFVPGAEPGEGATTGADFDLSMRHPGFPATYVDTVHVDLGDPDHQVWLEWVGPEAADGPRGPWRSAPGAGRAGVDCDDPAVSNTTDTMCTPKGRFAVAGFADRLFGTPECHYVTWVHFPRAIALHSHWHIPDHPASHGCIRLPYSAAKLIHNNSRVGVTHVHIHGTWTAPDRSQLRWREP